MIDDRIKLSVLHDENSVFTSYKENAADYSRDSFTLTLVSATDHLYLGFDRPFGSVYVELETPNTVSSELSAEYWDGSSWTAVSLSDESKSLTRSGFISWDRASMKSTSVNSEEAFFVRIKPSSDTSATVFRGINIVFSDDASLKTEFYDVDNPSLLPPSENSHIVSHVASREHIVQKLRSRGYIKRDENGYENITAWDLLDIYEVRQASMFWTLSNIFFNLSDDIDDQWWNKSKAYKDKFEEAFRLATLTLDQDNDGLVDENEKSKQFKNISWTR